MVKQNIILLDVDGTIGPYRNNAHHDLNKTTPFQGWERINSYYDVWLNKHMGGLLKTVANMTMSKLVWCTAWLRREEDLRKFAEYLNISIEFPGDIDKPEAVRLFSNPDLYNVVWFDDDPFVVPDHIKVIVPDPEVGLTVDILTQAFCHLIDNNPDQDYKTPLEEKELLIIKGEEDQ